MSKRFDRVEMAPQDFTAALRSMDMKKDTFVRLFGCDPRLVRRWEKGEVPIPHWVAPVMRVMRNVPTSIIELRKEAAQRIEFDRENPQNGRFPYLNQKADDNV